MYILKWSIDAWIYKICVSLYTFAADIYTLILDVAGAKIMDNSTVSTYARNISVLVGVFMLFRIAISLLSYLVDPDAMSDKKTGGSSLITGVLVTMLMLVTYSMCFKALRVVQDAILNPKDGNNVLVQLFSGSGNKEPGEHINGINCFYKNGASASISKDSYDVIVSLATNNGYKPFQYVDDYSKVWNVFQFTKIDGISVDRSSSYVYKYDEYKQEAGNKRISWFYADTIVYSMANSSAITIDTTTNKGTLNRCPNYLFFADAGQNVVLTDDINLITKKSERAATLDQSKTTKKAYVNDAGRIMAGSLLFSFVECDSAKDRDICKKLGDSMQINDMEGTIDYMLDDNDMNDAISFKSFLALLFGIVLILFLVTTTADVAVRTVKIMVLEVFAPIPIIAYSDPKTRDVFNSWIKTVGSVYADIFIRVIIIAICNFLVSQISLGSYRMFVKIALIIGILLFIKEAPQFICNALGIKAQGLGNFTLNPMDKLKQVPVIGSGVNAVSNAATQGWATLRSGGGFGKALLAAGSGAGDGWRKNGGMMSTGKEVAPGFATRTRQATVQAQKAREEKNRQGSRDEALYRITDEIQGSRHSTISRGNNKGTVVYQANTRPTLRDYVVDTNVVTNNINRTTQNIDNTTQNIDSKIP